MRSGSPALGLIGSAPSLPTPMQPNPLGGVALEAPKKGGGHSPIPKFFLKSLAKGDNNLYRMEFLAHSNWIHLLLA